MKNYLLVLTALCATQVLLLIFFMRSGHFTDKAGIGALIGLFSSILLFLLYLLNKQVKIERSGGRPELNGSIQQASTNH